MSNYILERNPNSFRNDFYPWIRITGGNTFQLDMRNEKERTFMSDFNMKLPKSITVSSLAYDHINITLHSKSKSYKLFTRLSLCKSDSEKTIYFYNIRDECPFESFDMISIALDNNAQLNESPIIHFELVD